jgi:hypothetical protein
MCRRLRFNGATALYRVSSLRYRVKLRTLLTNILQLVIRSRYNLIHLLRVLPLDHLYLVKCSVHKALSARDGARIARRRLP